ncbi:MAG: PA14 domain-containing protein [Polyangia bacterium]
MSEADSSDPISALKRAREKARVARALLDTAGVSPDEVCPHLRRGWIEIERGADAIERLGRGSGLATGGVPSRLRDAARADSGRIERAFDLYARGEKSGIGRAEWRALLRKLEKAVLELRRWRIRRAAPLWERALRWSGTSAAVLVAIAAVVLLGWGLAVTCSVPEPREGLAGTYFRARGFEGHSFERIDHGIDFRWGREPPLRGMPGDDYSVRWEGCIRVPQGGRRIVSGADDGMRVYVDDGLVIDNGGAHPYREKVSPKKIEPGVHRIRVEYEERRGAASAYLGWVSPGGVRNAVPAEHLSPPGGNESFDCPSRPVRKSRGTRARPRMRPRPER